MRATLRLLFSSKSIGHFEEKASHQLRRIYEGLEMVDDIETIEFDGSVLAIGIGVNRNILINRHGPSQQLWYSSFSGVDYFGERAGGWISQRSGKSLCELISEDLFKATGKEIQIPED